MGEQYDQLIAMVDDLTPERVFAISVAYAAMGFPHARFALIAAKSVGRMTEVTAALRRMAFNVQMYGMLNDVDVSGAVEAAKNAGIALATEDLIGTLGYSWREYHTLVDPWFDGFKDMPLREEKSA